MNLFSKIFKSSREPSIQEIRDAVRKKYIEVSRSTEGKFKYPTGKTGARALGYDLSVFMELPDEIMESFCGVGNPFSLGPIREGERLLDIGCGAGVDLIIAGRMTGLSGKVCGIDITPEMAEKARENLMRAGITNAEVCVAGVEEIPYGNGTFDIVISNGALNLSPEKEKSFQEIYRVLNSGGRLQFADIILKQELHPDTARSLEAWSE